MSRVDQRAACGADLHIDDRFNELLSFPVWPLPETAMGVLLYVTASWVPYHKHHQVRDTIIPFVRSKGSPDGTIDLPRPPAVTGRRKKQKQKRYPGCLSSSSERHVLPVSLPTEPSPTYTSCKIYRGGRAQLPAVNLFLLPPNLSGSIEVEPPRFSSSSSSMHKPRESSVP